MGDDDLDLFHVGHFSRGMTAGECADDVHRQRASLLVRYQTLAAAATPAMTINT
jgi:hypothetical protein